MGSSLIPLILLLVLKRKSNLSKILLMYFISSILLDSLTFYFYKFEERNSYFLTPCYFAYHFGLFSLFFYKSLNSQFLKKYVLLGFFLGSILLSFRAYFLGGFNGYDEKSWFGIQIFFISFTLFIFKFEFFRTKKNILNNSNFLISGGLFLVSFFPLLSGLFQKQLYETSVDYFQVSLIIVNFSNIVANLLYARGIYFLTPTATPMPSQRPRELS